MNITKKLIIALLVFSSLGIADAGYLTYEHYTGGSVICGISIADCDLVLHSVYSEIFGIPIALLGFLYYLSIFSGLLYFLKRKDKRIISLLPKLTGLGFVFSLFLVYVQLFVINAICLYCMGSALISAVLFALGLLLYRSENKKVAEKN